MKGEQSPSVPDGGWGWVVVCASFCNLFLLASIFTSLPILYVELIEVFEESNSRLSFLTSLQTAIVYFASVFTSALIPRFGARAMSVAGFLVVSTGLATSALVENFDGLFMTYAAIVGVGVSLGMPPAIVVVQQYFDKRRALAAGLSTCGVSVAALGGPALYRTLLNIHGWRGAYLLHGGILMHGIIISAAYRPLPAHGAGNAQTLNTQHSNNSSWHDRVQLCLKLFDLGLFKETYFLLYCFGNFFINYGLVAFYVHFVNCAIYKGVDKLDAMLLPVIMGTAALISRIIFSFVSNMKCVNRTLEYAVASLLCGFTIAIMFAVEGFLGLSAIAVAFGVITSIINVTQTTVMVDIVGVARVAPANGIFSFFAGVSILVASPLSGFLVDLTGNYDVPFVVNGGATAVGGILVLCIMILQVRRGTSSSSSAKKAGPETNGTCNHGNGHAKSNGVVKDESRETILSTVA